ncbi:CDP-glycerol glycerophosphotransferase family protein [Sphingomonas jaspsi]|uniref:CDP-glycerol glycerophosphotransferase family protein n=1 Tax=Sphingomonas jaspsi TaxID=392409 RepID=UPI0004B9A350|nr:CDP-glycerol glycerophosphotransferase family protein [Sphingomonas jaspsi]
MLRIGYLAFAQAHQHLHWIPGALALARRPGVAVDVLSASRANLDFIRRFDPDGLLRLRYLPVPHRRDGLFDVPPRAISALLWHPRLARYDALVTTETTSSVLKRLPWFKVPMIHLKHGAGDSVVGYNAKHRHFDLTLVNGEKDRERLIEKGLAGPDEIRVVGYAKFEAVGPDDQLFPDDRPVALYNAHAKAPGSSWFDHAPEIVAEMERIPGWNFIVAPHVKLKGGPRPTSSAPNILIDMGSRRSIDMSYTNRADVYIGDASSQVYEYIRTPRPCIFLNLDRVEWQGVERYSHWAFGQVIDDIAELGPALSHAAALQPDYEAAQRAGLARSLDPSPLPSSQRQADAILDFLARR